MSQDSSATELLEWDTDDYKGIAAGISARLDLPGKAREDAGRPPGVVQDSSSGLEAIRMEMEHTAERLPEVLEEEIANTYEQIKDREGELGDCKAKVDRLEKNWPTPTSLTDDQPYNKRADDYKEFKKDHGLKREPRPPGVLRLLIAVIALSALGESTLNMFVLYEAQDGGWLQAFGYALLWSGVNIALAIGFGMCTRELLYRKWPTVVWRVPLAGIAWLGLAALVVVINLGFGRLRDLLATGQTFQEASTEAVRQVKEMYLLIPESVAALVLIVVGGVIVVAVSYKTFTFIDPYPRFWAEHKLLTKARKKAENTAKDKNSQEEERMQEIRNEIETVGNKARELFRGCRAKKWITERVADHRLNRLALMLCDNYYKPAYINEQEKAGPDSPPYLPPEEFNISVDKDKQESCAIELEKQAQKIEEVQISIAEQRLRMTRLITRWQTESALAVADRPATDDVVETTNGDQVTS